MSIEQPDVVDAVGIEKKTGDVVLTISDHLDWIDEQEHLRALQEKVDTYLRFVKSGELFEKYPETAGRKVVLDIVGRVPLSDAGKRFVTAARESLEASGFELRSRTLEDDEGVTDG
jgi:L-ascorbate metabolism protein UlaG (beta-lactamase superfamily)